MSPPYAALRFAALLHLLVTALWFASGVLLPTRAIWNDGLLLVPTFAASGLLLIHGRLVVSLPNLAWGAALLDFLGLAPLALYAARILFAAAPAAAATEYARALWEREPVITLYVLALLAATALVHLFTIVVCLMFVYGNRGDDDDDDDDDDIDVRGRHRHRCC